MIVSTYTQDNRRAEIHDEGYGLIVRLYENNIMIEVRDLQSYSIHYAESLAENFVHNIGEFYNPSTKQFLTE
jgi:hypothetical protein